MAAGANHGKLKCVRFGPFRFNPLSGELERSGVSVPLQNTPARLLAELVAKPGILCTREELCAQLWPADVYVDFENNLNNAVARLRQSLGGWESGCIETVPRRGYRFTGEALEDSSLEPPPVTAAGQALRKGRHFRNRTTLRDLWRAVAYFQQAIQEQPDCADGYAGLSDAYILLGDDVLGGLPADEALPQASEAARRALDIDANCAAAHTTLAMVDWRLHWDWRGAEERFRQALALDSNSAPTFQYYSWLLQASGRPAQSREAMTRALALDPASPFVSANVGWMLYLDRRYSEALAHLRESVELDENYALVHLPLGYVLQQTGRLPEAITHFRFGLARGGDGFYRAALGQALAQAGFAGEAASIAASLEGSRMCSFNQAMIYAGLGRDEDTLRCLESSVAEHSSSVPYLDVDPIFDGVRGNRRYQGIAQRVGIG
jgi:DNA-binding winged helix-turn-helix (wHTH) protein